jgi:nucleoid-associated protein YgaU
MSRYSGLPIYQASFGEFFAVPTIPNVDEIFQKVATSDHIWKVGERLDKLAYLYYKNENLWWVICWFNRVADEAELQTGQVLLIPQNPEFIIAFFDKKNRTVGAK